ncbi:NUDIX domain-containing protein [Patescibacteria group bacterium]
MLDSYKKWTFPKGRVEAGEYLEEGAARETMEELGLEEIRLIDSLGKIDIWFRDKFEKQGALVHKDIYYFLFEAGPGAKLSADPKHHSYDVKWVSIKKLTSISYYADMVPIIKKALVLIKDF